MKKIIKILLICLLIAGIIVIAIKGFNVGLQYSNNTQIAINIGKQFDIKDIKEITKEVFPGQNVIIQKIEIYEDMAEITVKSATDDQISDLNTKINDKYELSNEVSDLSIINNTNMHLKEIAKPYLLPIGISFGIIVVYLMILYRKLGALKVLYRFIINTVGSQMVLFSIYAITRLPINKYTIVVSITIYVAAVVYSALNFEKNKQILNNKTEKKDIEEIN